MFYVIEQKFTLLFVNNFEKYSHGGRIMIEQRIAKDLKFHHFIWAENKKKMNI